MARYRWIFLILFFVTSVIHARADAPPKGFDLHKFNPPNQQPMTDKGVTNFHLGPRVCSNTDYGDGRGETDCKNGNIRSILRWTSTAKVGETIEYRFDVRVDPRIKYAGFRNLAAVGYYPNAIDSHLRIASWEGPGLYNFIYMLKVDTTNGVSFLARQCQAPSDFGKWVTFSLKTRWSSDESGWVKVTCNDKLVYADEGVATNQAPHCWRSNECEPEVKKSPKSFNFLLGPVMMGFGPDWRKITGAKSVWDDMQPDGLDFQMRNVVVKRDAELYGPAEYKTLQQLKERLSALGCDTGKPDDMPTVETRKAAQSCRQFPKGTLPEKLTVATVADFLKAYSDPAVAALPKEVSENKAPGLLKARYTVMAAEDSAQKAGRDPEVNSNIEGTIKGAKKGENRLSFILFGPFNFSAEDFYALEFIIQDSLDKKSQGALSACNAPTITYPDGSVHLSLKMRKKAGAVYAPPSSIECILKALPKGQAAQAKFLTESFPDIAIAMVKNKTVSKMRHEGARMFMANVANGKISFARE